MNSDRLRVAKEMGADSTILISKEETPEQVAARVVVATVVAPHASIDCAGFQSTISVGLLVCLPVAVIHHESLDMLF